MKSSKLVTYLTEVGRYEQRIEIAREILARNMNFSPSWLLALVADKGAGEGQDTLKIGQMRILFDMIGLACENKELVAVFQYFDKEGRGVVRHQDFVEFLLPSIKDGLRKAVIKRQPTDIEFTMELKHALRRIFTQILKAKSQLKLYQGEFGLDPIHSTPQPTKQALAQFLSKFGKYPTESQLALLTKFILDGRNKEIDTSHLCHIVEECGKEVQFLAENPAVLNRKIEDQVAGVRVKELEGLMEVEKIVNRGQIQNIYNEKLYPRLPTAAFAGSRNEEKIKNLQGSPAYQFTRTPISHKNNLIEDAPHSKSDSTLKFEYGQEFKHPNFKIQRTNSIIHNEEKQKIPENEELKRAEKLANQLLTTQPPKKEETKEKETPFRKLQPAAQNPTIYYSSRRKTSQPSQSDYQQLLSTNLQLEQQIERHRLDNQARMRQARSFLKYDTAY